MSEFFKNIKPYQYLVWLGLIFITFFAIYTPNQFLFKELAKFGVQVMFICLLLGLLFLMLRDPRSMWVSLICCGILCLHLRTREPFYPIQYGTIFKIAHINLGNSTDYEATIKAILNSKADIISFQELDPNWDYVLQENLKKAYPYHKTIISLGVYNPAVYSKYMFNEIDTFHYKEAPNIHGCVTIEDQKVHFITSTTMPPVDMNAYAEIKAHLLKIGDFVADIDKPILALGDYNVVMHSDEVSALKTRGNLKDSRRDYSPMTQSPYDHILYSLHLECTNFLSIREKGGDKIGIIGTYQFNRNYAEKDGDSKTIR
jgi:hypothetical protein